MANERLIVCERNNCWAVALRWALTGLGLRVFETRTWADCRQEIDATKLTLLALEMRKDNVAEVYRWLIALRQSFPNAGAVVLTDRELSEHEWTLREFGALHVAISQRNLTPVAKLIQRFFSRATDSRQTPYELCGSHLPWPEANEQREAK